MNPPAEVPQLAVLAGDADPLGFAERTVWTDRMLETLRKGGPEGGKWYWLHDKVFCPDTLRTAFARVEEKDGAPGVDHVTVEQFAERLDEEIERVCQAWQAESFVPQAIRRTYIDKPGSHEQRPLGIPTVRDRMVQTALKLVLEPIFEMTFHDSSYGFRPGRSTKDALTVVERGLHAGKTWVVDADLRKYFDSIPHGALLAKVQQRVTDRRILGLLEQYLRAGILEDGTWTLSEEGSPQGGVISPLLANIYLNDFDHHLAESGWTVVRYADDFVVLCTSEEDAQAALSAVQAWVSAAGLILHPEKTRVVDLGTPGNHIDFLGVRFKRIQTKGGERKLLRLCAAKSHRKVKDTIRRLTPRTPGCSLETTINFLNRSLRGWFGYFRSLHRSVHRELDQLIRRRLRAILCRFAGYSSWGGNWATVRWPNAFFHHHGLFSLEATHEEFLQSHWGNR
jgi:RNA-directed DNA polymerase